MGDNIGTSSYWTLPYYTVCAVSLTLLYHEVDPEHSTMTWIVLYPGSSVFLTSSQLPSFKRDIQIPVVMYILVKYKVMVTTFLICMGQSLIFLKLTLQALALIQKAFEAPASFVHQRYIITRAF